LNIEIHEFADPDNGETSGYYCKGHIEPDAFAAALLEQYDMPVDPARVQQLYIRWGWASYTGERKQYAMEYHEPGRGRFKATQIYLFW